MIFFRCAGARRGREHGRRQEASGRPARMAHEARFDSIIQLIDGSTGPGYKMSRFAM